MGWWWAASCRNRGQPGHRFPKRRTPSPRLMCLRRRLDEKPTSESGVERGGDPCGPYTGRFFRKGVSEVGCVILSAAKDLRWARREILRCAQDDSLWRPARFKKPTRVRTLVVARLMVARCELLHALALVPSQCHSPAKS